MDDCMLCSAERLTDRLHEDDDCWVADCVVCMTPMVVWRTHGLPDPAREATLLSHLERVAAARYGEEGYYVDPERRRIPTTGTRTRDPPAASSTRAARSSRWRAARGEPRRARRAGLTRRAARTRG